MKRAILRFPAAVRVAVVLLILVVGAMWISKRSGEGEGSVEDVGVPPSKISQRDELTKDASSRGKVDASRPDHAERIKLPEPRGVGLIDLGLNPEEVAEVEQGVAAAKRTLTEQRREKMKDVVLKIGRTYLIPSLPGKDIERAAETVSVPAGVSDMASTLIPEMVLAELERTYGSQATLEAAQPGEHNVVFSSLKDGVAIVVTDAKGMTVNHVSGLRDEASMLRSGFEFGYLLTPEFRAEVQEAEAAYRAEKMSASRQ